MRRSLFIKALLVVVFVLTFHLLALKFYWYTSIWWYDMMMHTGGGIFLALAVGALTIKETKPLGWWDTVVLILLAVFVIGLLWEYYEYFIQWLLKPIPFADFDDSISDLLCDMFGGGIGSIFVLRAKRKYNR